MKIKTIALTLILIMLLSLVPVSAESKKVTTDEIVAEMVAKLPREIKTEYELAKLNEKNGNIQEYKTTVIFSGKEETIEFEIDNSMIGITQKGENEKMRILDIASNNIVVKNKETNKDEYQSYAIVTIEIAGLEDESDSISKILSSNILGTINSYAAHDDNYEWDSSYAVQIYVKGYFNWKYCGFTNMATPYRIDGKVIQSNDPTVKVDWIYPFGGAGFTRHDGTGKPIAIGDDVEYGTKVYSPSVGKTYYITLKRLNKGYYNIKNGVDYIGFGTSARLSRGTTTWTIYVNRNAD